MGRGKEREGRKRERESVCVCGGGGGRRGIVYLLVISDTEDTTVAADMVNSVTVAQSKRSPPSAVGR